MRALALLPLLCLWCVVAAGDHHAKKQQEQRRLRRQQLGGPCSSDEDCSLLGTCAAQPPRRCLCDAGWSGEGCETPSCPQSCSARGRCLAGGVCECDEGWFGWGNAISPLQL